MGMQMLSCPETPLSLLAAQLDLSCGRVSHSESSLHKQQAVHSCIAAALICLGTVCWAQRHAERSHCLLQASWLLHCLHAACQSPCSRQQRCFCWHCSPEQRPEMRCLAARPQDAWPALCSGRLPGRSAGAGSSADDVHTSLEAQQASLQRAGTPARGRRLSVPLHLDQMPSDDNGKHSDTH